MRAPQCLLASLLAVIPIACGDGGPMDPPRPTTVTVIPAASELSAVGDTVQLRAEVRDQSRNLMDGVAVTWQSSSTAVATVSGSGLVTAVANGRSSITATAGTVSGSSILDVRQVVDSTAVLPAADTLILGDSVRLTAEGFDAGGHPVADAQFRWWSNNPQVATVDNAGVARAVSQGVAEIHAATRLTRGVARITVFSPDRAALVALYHATDGPNWVNNDNWLSDAPIWSWHGVVTNTDGRVTSINLGGRNDSQSGQWTRHGLKGTIPPEVGSLAELAVLWLHGNELSGTIPASLGNLARLKSLDLSGNGLTGPIPTELGGLANLATVALHTNSLEGAIPPELGNLTRLVDLALSDNGLSGTIPATLGDLAELRHLDLSDNNLTGPIPPEVGNLAELTILWLHGNELSGTIPASLGNLARLESLDLSGNDLTAGIPVELGNLEDLIDLRLHHNALTAGIPEEFGRLRNLEILTLLRNNLTGPLPAQLGSLHNLTRVDLRDNALTGPLPRELGNLSRLERLLLAANELTGPVPREFGGMASLRELYLANNADLSGALPAELTALTGLEVFLAGATNLCAPPEPAFARWLNGVDRKWIRPCPKADPVAAYLIQAAQSREFPVPLVAGEQALLRVFVTAREATAEGIPAMRALFYLDGLETYAADIAGKSSPIPTEVDESSLDRSANVVIPGGVIRPGLEMVIEVDPDGTLDSGLGVAKRIPGEGRLKVDVRAMPPLDLTLIPFIWTERHDSSVVDLIRAMEADPENHDMLGLTRTLLPVHDLTVTAHEPVLTSTNNTFTLLAETRAIRAMEGGTGHYAGLMPPPLSGGATGAAVTPGRSTFQVTSPVALAHELGHNMSLLHPACVGDTDSDLAYPYADGVIGIWGYDFQDGGSLVPPSKRDLMGDCILGLPWISDYNFIRALQFRLGDEASTGQPDRAAQSTVLLWGGLHADGAPFLEPAFVVDAPALLPDAAGDHHIVGTDADGVELFSLSFAMPEVAHGGGRSAFAFAVPVRSSWVGVPARITLSGPGGTVVLDGDSDHAVAILRDPRTGQVRGILRDVPVGGGMRAVAMAGSRATLEILFSRGVPDAVAWKR